MSADDYTRHQQTFQHPQQLLQIGTDSDEVKMEPTSSSTAVASSTSGSSSKTMRRKQSNFLHMEEEKYIALRKRNNIAVRKSREKQRAKQNEIIKTLSVLRDENSSLQSTVAARIRELNLLNNLLKQVKHAPPKRLSKLLSAYNVEQGSEISPDTPLFRLNGSVPVAGTSSPAPVAGMSPYGTSTSQTIPQGLTPNMGYQHQP